MRIKFLKNGELFLLPLPLKQPAPLLSLHRFVRNYFDTIRIVVSLKPFDFSCLVIFKYHGATVWHVRMVFDNTELPIFGK